MTTALLSVSDKTGIVELARALCARGVQLLSTGGTARLLAEAGLPVTEVADVTGFPEMLDGRVKTLHPHIHGGLLARRDVPEHMQALAAHGIAPIDLVVINLYPFARAVARPSCTLDEAIENIDVGGPAMLRAAAKNWTGVGVVIDPADYPQVLAELDAGGLSDATRYGLARKVFAHTSAYDAMIAGWLGSLADGAESNRADVPGRAEAPRFLSLQFELVQPLRYGENPHQHAAFYRERDREPAPGSLARAVQRQGKALSYNNLADADAAWNAASAFDAPACVIVKHANPCGVAVAATLAGAYANAFRTDPTSAFGGILAFNRPFDGATAQAVAQQFAEVVLAPSFTPEALAAFAGKPNVRLLEMGRCLRAEAADPGWDCQRVSGGLLWQTADLLPADPASWRVVTRRAPTEAERADLAFAWQVAQFVKSNAIVFGAGGMTLGVGAGQMSRIDSARIAASKAAAAGLSLAGSAVASDAFFPFRDGLDSVVDAGARCVVQPGGSMRDAEVIAAADERDVAMVFTGVRHFRH